MQRDRDFFFFNDTATTEIYTLSLHDALPISGALGPVAGEPTPAGHDVHRHVRHAHRHPAPPVRDRRGGVRHAAPAADGGRDRKSTRLNSSHANISYAVFCLKKKKYTRLIILS